jgi:hypothetical protein
MSFIYTPPPAAGSAVTPVLCQTITLAAIQGLIASSTLVCGRLYTITNPFQNSNGYGTVTVKATSTSTVDPTAVWNKPFNGVSIGGLLYDSSMGPGNTIDNLIVNGVNLLSTPIGFNTSLVATMIDLANDINTFAATTLTATATPGGVILVDSVVQTLYNGTIPSSVVTGFPGPYQTYALLYGEDPTNPPIQLPIVYDINIGSLLSCYDYRTNNTITSFNNDTVVFEFPFNFSGIINSTFNNTFFLYTSLYAGFIDIDNCTFNNSTFINILFATIRVTDSTINNVQCTSIDGIDFAIFNCEFLYPKQGPGVITGTFNPTLLFNNVETDGRSYTCSGTTAFSGNPGTGAVGTPIFLQTSPDRFAYKNSYRVQIYGASITGGIGASLEIGTNTTPNGLVNVQLSTAFNGVVNVLGTSFGPDTIGQFIITPTVDNTTAGILTYVITGFTPL